MTPKDMALLGAAFKRYYFDHAGLVRVPPRPREREFAYKRFDTGMIRHLALSDDRDLRLLIAREMPSDVYCSNGYYSFPTVAMSDKNWREADLIFDIDAKDLKLDCRPSHTCTRCLDCGSTRAGPSPCGCGSTKAESSSFPCKKCIKASKEEVKKLLEMLEHDLGIPSESTGVFFSGNEGFHVEVDHAAYRTLDKRGRAMLCEYIRFQNIMPEALGVSRASYDLPGAGEAGWRGRAAKILYKERSKTEIKKGGYDSFAALLGEVSGRAGASIDPSVTMDVHRVFRLAGTLNGKSGLAKMKCTDLGGFDPYTEACLIDGAETEVDADCPVRFGLNGGRFGPYDGACRVPLYAAVYMICKGFARSV